MRDLGTLTGTPGYPSAGIAINDLGQVAGNSNLTAVLWSGGRIYPLGTIATVGGPNTPSEALGLNAAGAIVGFAGDPNDPSSPNSRAWIWVPTTANAATGQITDLNTLIPAGSGWVLSRATSINNAGPIVGTGQLSGRLRAFLLSAR
jgi:hypothetical protein